MIIITHHKNYRALHGEASLRLAQGGKKASEAEKHDFSKRLDAIRCLLTPAKGP